MSQGRQGLGVVKMDGICISVLLEDANWMPLAGK
jgi:hypothetical protein